MDAVAATGMDTCGRRDDVGTGEVVQHVLVDRVTGAVHYAPPAALAPLPPGPADPEIVGLVKGRVDIRGGTRRAQIVAKLADPERRRHLGGLLDTLLKPRPEKRRIAVPVGWDEGSLVDVCAVNEVRRFEVEDRRVHGEQQDALDEEQVIRVDAADRLDRLFEHRKEVELLEDAGWDRQRMRLVEDVVTG